MAPEKSSKQRKPKPARTRTRLSVADRRRQLLELGLEAFTRQPYDEVAIDEIARAAGISRGLLFHYFPTKHAYYAAVLGRAAEMLHETVLGASTRGTPGERLEAGLRAYFRFVDEHATSYATLLRGGVGSDPVVLELVERSRRTFLDTIRDNLEALVGPREPARMRAALRGWIGLVEALALDWIDHRDLATDELVAMAARAIALVVPGLEALEDR